MSQESQRDAWAWWGARRLRYNVMLALAGIVAFVLYLVALAVRCADTDYEVTVFTILVQGILYLFAMGIANLCYNLGPALESRLGGRDVATYRRDAFRAGLWFSVALPFLVPAIIFVFGCRGDAPR
jgi:hypothetical protein